MANGARPKSEALERATTRWSTISNAVESGWGPTLRLLSIIALRGALVVGAALVAGHSGMFELARELVLNWHP